MRDDYRYRCNVVDSPLRTAEFKFRGGTRGRARETFMRGCTVLYMSLFRIFRA